MNDAVESIAAVMPPGTLEAVPYTPLTLPTHYSVSLSMVHVPVHKTKERQ